jgi:hypothetical protein
VRAKSRPPPTAFTGGPGARQRPGPHENASGPTGGTPTSGSTCTCPSSTHGSSSPPCAADADFKASLWGDDGASGPDASDDHIRDLNIKPGWPITDSTGIAAEFISPNIHTSELDEDDREDQIYARVSFYDCNAGRTRYFTTSYLYVQFYLVGVHAPAAAGGDVRGACWSVSP